MRGEVSHEFTHAVTGEGMLLVYFSSVIGQVALAKLYCLPEGADGAGPSYPAGGQRPRSGPSSPPCGIGTQQHLIGQFEALSNDIKGLAQFLVAVDVEFTSRNQVFYDAKND